MDLFTTLKSHLPTRRRFLRRTAQTAIGLTTAAGLTGVYGYLEASRIRIRRSTVTVPNLPRAFAGKTIAVLADLHHGPLVSISYIREAVALANALKPDAVALVGDFAHDGHKTLQQLPPCLEALSALSAPLGVFAVPGNHDMQNHGAIYRDTIGMTPLRDLTNRNERITIAGEHLWLAGVDDHWWGRPDQAAALKNIPDGAAVILLCHNPDYAEEYPDPRVGLMLSGHTHGGQLCVPMYGPLWLPSRYGTKYQYGLVQGPASQVFISCGLGVAAAHLRINCPPEINLLTLA